MPVFKYVGMVGSKRTEGELEAPSIEDAKAILTGRNVKIEKIYKKPTEIKLSFGTGIKTKDIVVFTRQFATMLNAGIPIVECLTILSTQAENPALRKVLSDVKTNVEGGVPLADSLRKHGKIFDPLYCSLVEAGEAGGLLTGVLERLSGYMEKSQAIKGKVKGAMVYPVIILIVATVIVGGLLYFVIPKFADMFAGMGRKLPFLTQFVIDASNYLTHNILMILGVIIGFIVVFSLWKKTEKGAFLFDAFLLKVPLIGNIIKKSAVARFTRTFGTLTSAGVEILSGMAITAKTSGNKVIEKALLDARDDVAGGSGIAEPLKKAKIFPPMVISMIAAGEKSGAMEDMLNKIADFYELEVDSAVEALTSAMEPLIMVVLGGVIGTIVIALFLPILTMANGI